MLKGDDETYWLRAAKSAARAAEEAKVKPEGWHGLDDVAQLAADLEVCAGALADLNRTPSAIIAHRQAKALKSFVGHLDSALNAIGWRSKNGTLGSTAIAALKNMAAATGFDPDDKGGRGWMSLGGDEIDRAMETVAALRHLAMRPPTLPTVLPQYSAGRYVKPIGLVPPTPIAPEGVGDAAEMIPVSAPTLSATEFVVGVTLPQIFEARFGGKFKLSYNEKGNAGPNAALAFLFSSLQAMGERPLNEEATLKMFRLATAKIAALDDAFVVGLSITDIAEMTAAEVEALSTTQIGAFSVTQIAAISTTGVKSLSVTHIRALSPAQAKALTADQLTALTTTPSGTLTTTQVQALTTTNIDALTTTQVAALTAGDIAALTAV